MPCCSWSFTYYPKETTHMKKILQILFLLLMGIPFSAKAGTTVGSPLTSSDQLIPTGSASSEPTSATSNWSLKTDVIASVPSLRGTKQSLSPRSVSSQTGTVSAPIFGIGKPKYNQRRIQRQNTVGKTNRRAKRIQRKNGIGLLPSLRGTKQSPSPETEYPQTGILTINPLLI